MPRAYLFPLTGPIVEIQVTHDEDELFRTPPHLPAGRSHLLLTEGNRGLVIDEWHDKPKPDQVPPPVNTTIAPYYPDYPLRGPILLVAFRFEEDEEGNEVEDPGIIDVDLPALGTHFERDWEWFLPPLSQPPPPPSPASNSPRGWMERWARVWGRLRYPPRTFRKNLD